MPSGGPVDRDVLGGHGRVAARAVQPARSPFDLGPRRRELRIIAIRPREVSDAFEGALPLLHNLDLQELLRVQRPVKRIDDRPQLHNWKIGGLFISILGC